MNLNGEYTSQEEYNRALDTMIDLLTIWSDGDFTVQHNKKWGICNNLGNAGLFTRSLWEFFEETSLRGGMNTAPIMDEFFMSWEHFSGNTAYPVEGCEVTYARVAKWANDANGDKRRDLCRHFAEQLVEYKDRLQSLYKYYA